MHTPEEIAAIKCRLGALEYEFQQLQRLVATWDQPPPLPAAIAPVLPPPIIGRPATALSTATPADARLPILNPVSAIPVAPTPPPIAAVIPPPPPLPVLPPVIVPPPVISPGPAMPESGALPPLLPSRPVAPPIAKPHPWREWLEPLQLWPPAGEDNAEVRLAAWWATRVGALLAVIGIVFLGIYVSRNSPPWVRLAEVMVVTAGVIGLGSWLERKLPKFGAVVFGAGLALAYFCAFAAYAVGPMKVITQPLTASVCELVVVGLILVVAWRRNSPLVATMAVVLGHVTAFLALRNESAGFGPWVVLLLGIAAVILRLARGWEAPSALAMPLTWLFLATASFARGPGPELSLTAIWLWTGLYLALFMARDWIVASRGVVLGTADRSLQVISSSLAVMVGLAAALRAGGDNVSQFFFGSGVVMLLAAWAWQRVGARALVPIFVCKGAGLIALGVIDALAGQARCLVLLAQAFVMLVSARHSHQRWLRTATILAGVLALAFFIEELRPIGATFRDPVTALEVVFLAGAVGFVAALRRWLDLGVKSTAAASTLLGVVAVVVASHWKLNGWNAAAEVGVAVILLVAGATVRGWLAGGIAAGIVLLAGHLEIWLFDRERFPVAALWGGELALVVAGLAAAVATRRLAHEPLQRGLRLWIVTIGGATLIAAFFKGLEPAPALAAGVALALLFVGVAPLLRQWNLAAFAAPAIALSCALLLPHTPTGASPWLWLVAACAWAAPLWLTASRSRLESISTPEWRAWVPAVHTALALGLTLLAIVENLQGGARVMGLAVAGLVVAGFAWRPGLRPALEASWILWVAAFAVGSEIDAHPALWFAAATSWLPAILLVRLPALQALRASLPNWRTAADSIQVFIATGLTLLALTENLQGEVRIAGVMIAAVAALALAWQAGLRAALESSWLFWCVVIAWVMQGGASTVAWIAVGAAWLPAIMLGRVAGFQPLRSPPPWWRARADAVQVSLAAVLGGCVALEYAGSRRLVAFAVVIGIALVVWRAGRVSSARPAVAALGAAAWLSAGVLSILGRAEGWGAALAAVLGIAVLVLALPFALEHDLDFTQRTRLRWPAAAAGLGLACLVLIVQRGEVAPYATVGCGLAAVGTFLVGLVARSRPHRLCGLAGLALCVPRAFLVDLHSTLHRIAAFVALGVVLLWVGFSYHRFRHLIVEQDKKL